MLTDVVRKYNGRNWKKIAEAIPGRSDVQCLHRWQKVLNPELVKGPWTKQEDDHIRELVEKHGCGTIIWIQALRKKHGPKMRNQLLHITTRFTVIDGQKLLVFYLEGLTMQ